MCSGVQKTQLYVVEPHSYPPPLKLQRHQIVVYTCCGYNGLHFSVKNTTSPQHTKQTEPSAKRDLFTFMRLRHAVLWAFGK